MSSHYYNLETLGLQKITHLSLCDMITVKNHAIVMLSQDKYGNALYNPVNCFGFVCQDPKWLTQVHGSIGTAGNATALRLLYYPPIPEESNIKPEQVRCGEHSDYGSITLLFQDSVGGLEVRTVLN